MSLAARAGGPRNPAWWWWLLAALLHVLPFAARPALIGGDEPHYALAAHSLASDFDLHLEDDYLEVERGGAAAGAKRAGQHLDRHVRQLDGRSLFSHPIGLPLLAAPVLFLLGLARPGAAPDIPLVLLTLALSGAAAVAAWRWLSETLGDARQAALGIAALCWSTPLWYYNRTFFTEPFLVSFLVLTALALARRRAWRCGLWLALALTMKETAALAAVPLLVAAAAWLGWRRALRVAAGPALFAAFFLAKNWALAGTPWVAFQAFDSGPWARGAWGLLFDRRHGLAWFAPLLLLAAPALWIALRGAGGLPAPEARGRRIALATAAAIFGAFFVLTGAWADWGGGASYGTRLLLPALPALAVMLILAWPDLGPGWRRLAAALFAAGFTVQWCAATDPVPAMWSIPISDLVRRRPGMAVAGLALAVAVLGAARATGRPKSFAPGAP